MANKKWLTGLTKGWKCDVNRNTFSRSHRHYATYNFGKIYPIYARSIHANETLTIKPAMLFDMVPTNHKIRNNITAHVRFFYVPLRTLWQNYQSFSMQDKTKNSTDFVHPYLSRAGQVLNEQGSLLNHMGIPAVAHAAGSHWMLNTFYTADSLVQKLNGQTVDLRTWFTVACRNIANGGDCHPVDTTVFDPALTQFVRAMRWRGSIPFNFADFLDMNPYIASPTKNDCQIFFSTTPMPKDISYDENHYFMKMPHVSSASDISSNWDIVLYSGSDILNSRIIGSFPLTAVRVAGDTYAYNFDGEHTVSAATHYEFFKFKIPSGLTQSVVEESFNALVSSQDKVFAVIVRSPATSTAFRAEEFACCGLSVLATEESEKITYSYSSGYYEGLWFYTDRVEQVASDTRFDGSNASYRLNALFARAYRAIYNGYFRNRTLDPFCPAVNPHDSSDSTIPYVDRYVENLDDGADTDTPLELEYCRFDEDYYSGCLPSPTMMNNRPLVGVTYQKDVDNTALLRYVDNADPTDTGNITVIVDNATGPATNAKVTGISSHEGFDPSSFTIETLKDAIRVGINLDDLRNVQALTRWYEATYKAGRFSWGDFMAAHFGVMPKYNARLCPELLMACDMALQEYEVINSTSPSTPDGVPLGAHGGVGRMNGDCDTVRCFSDEDAIVMGVVYFTCNNAMTDAINREWFRALPGDYPATEFADLGMQPVLKREVAPLITQNPTDIFAYQRVYGDLLESHDTVAGEFCNELRDELMVRQMTGEPTLSQEFLTMTPEDFTNCFVEPVSADKFYGSWLFDETTCIWLSQRPNQVIL